MNAALNVLIGPNQSGKTNLLDALDLFGRAARGQLKSAIQQTRGGFSNLLWAGKGANGLSFDIDLIPNHSLSSSISISCVEQALADAGSDLGDEAEPLHESERALVGLLLGFPGEFQEAVARRAPHRIAAHALELAQGFTAFYRDCKVLGAEPEALESWRLALSVASMAAIARSLELLGVSAPERM